MLHCFYPLQVIMPSPLTFQEHGTLDWSPLAPRSCGALGGGSTWGHWHHSSEAHSDGWKNSGSGLREWEEGTGMLIWAQHILVFVFLCLDLPPKDCLETASNNVKTLLMNSLGQTNDFYHTVTASSCIHFVTHVTPENCGARIACNFKDTKTYLPQVMSPSVPRGRRVGVHRKQPWLSHHTCC